MGGREGGRKKRGEEKREEERREEKRRGEKRMPGKERRGKSRREERRGEENSRLTNIISKFTSNFWTFKWGDDSVSSKIMKYKLPSICFLYSGGKYRKIKMTGMGKRI
jgi:hypothetical protein